MSETFVIVGAGLAGAKAAETLRDEGFEGRVLLVGAEPEAPYERPPLSKGYLMGKAERDDARVHPSGFYDERDIELVTGTRVTALDTTAHRVTLGDVEHGYDRLLLATGAVPRRPPIPGLDGPGVMTLRTLADADTLLGRLRPGVSVAVIGAGWIGCEVAAAARSHGAEVTLIEQAATPLEAVLGPELGEVFAALHRANGVQLLTGARVRGIESGERGTTVLLDAGAAVDADVVVVGVGVAPDTALAEAAGLSVENGVVVDELLRTSAPDVFAAGDVASAFHPRYGEHVRVEHWANALNQGPAAARSMLDRGEPYTRVPYFFSDQYSLGMEYAGLHRPGDRVVIRGERFAEQFQAFWVDADDRVTAGMHVNDWDAIEPIKQLVESDEPIDRARLADVTAPIGQLAPR
jgi:3-phenylpropionate/trans-cinnamate dioxygenase ferredoxin reductase component